MTGSDRDAHGCIPSAGHVWWDHGAQCERSWELARQQGLEQAPEAFAAYCGNPATD